MLNRDLLRITEEFNRNRDLIRQMDEIRRWHDNPARRFLENYNPARDFLNHPAYRIANELANKRELFPNELSTVNNFLHNADVLRDFERSNTILEQIKRDEKLFAGSLANSLNFPATAASVLQKQLAEQNHWLKAGVLDQGGFARDFVRENSLLWQSSLHRGIELIEKLPSDLMRENAFSQLSVPEISYGRFLNQTNRLLERAPNELRQNQILNALDWGQEGFRNGIGYSFGVLEQLASDVSQSDRMVVVPPPGLQHLNLFRVTRREILRETETDATEADEMTIPNSIVIQNSSRRLLDLVTEINFNARHGGAERDVFKVTNQTLRCSALIPFMIVENQSSLSEFVNSLFLMLYEGAGSAKLRFVVSGFIDPKIDDEFEALMALKDLRNKWFFHDQEHGSEGEIRSKFKSLGETLSYLGLNGSPRRRDEFVLLQVNLLNGLNTLLELVLERIKQKNQKTNSEPQS